MKQKLLNSIFFAVLTLFIHTDALAWGETTSYVLDAPAEYTLNTIETGPTLALSGPGATLTFQAKRQTAANKRERAFLFIYPPDEELICYYHYTSK